jgi:hypothetical protein
MKRPAYRHLMEGKWGPAKTIEILLKNKKNVEFKENQIIAYGWEATQIRNVQCF